MKVLKTLGIALAVAPLFAASMPAALDAQQTVTTPVVSATVADLPVSATSTPAALANAAAATSPGQAPTTSLGMAPSVTSTNAAPVSGTAATAVALRMKHATTDAPAPLPRGTANSKALMIVGAAAVLAGIIVGDDAGTVLILGGAGIGLYGLYKYMQ